MRLDGQWIIPLLQIIVMVLRRRRVKLFRYGPHQAVFIPHEFELSGEEAVMRKEGERLIVELVSRKSLLAVLATLGPFDEDFSPIPEIAVNPQR